MSAESALAVPLAVALVLMCRVVLSAVLGTFWLLLCVGLVQRDVLLALLAPTMSAPAVRLGIISAHRPASPAFLPARNAQLPTSVLRA